ncbi:MAG: hypothetical protein MZV63_46625 [Marinilabiliales bacterium]|nr:hypothetical protein [Marinilabiliales bacterium]
MVCISDLDNVQRPTDSTASMVIHSRIGSSPWPRGRQQSSQPPASIAPEFQLRHRPREQVALELVAEDGVEEAQSAPCFSTPSATTGEAERMGQVDDRRCEASAALLSDGSGSMNDLSILTVSTG